MNLNILIILLRIENNKIHIIIYFKSPPLIFFKLQRKKLKSLY